MKKFIVLTLAGVLCIAAAQAGISGIGVDFVQTNYTAGNGELVMDDSGLVVTIDYDNGDPQGEINPASFYLKTQHDSGMHFAGGTFVFTDNTGVASTIISGTVIGVDFSNAGSFLVGEGTAEVLVSNLAGYPLGSSEIVSITFNLDPAFTDFGQDYSGLSKVNFLVPEPATMALLALGGMLIRKRK